MTIKTITVPKSDFDSEQDIRAKIIELSKSNPQKHITVTPFFTKIQFHLHNTKPRSINSKGAEHTYRTDGGFWKNGKIIKPSAAFIKQFNFCPVQR